MKIMMENHNSKNGVSKNPANSIELMPTEHNGYENEWKSLQIPFDFPSFSLKFWLLLWWQAPMHSILR